MTATTRRPNNDEIRLLPVVATEEQTLLARERAREMKMAAYTPAAYLVAFGLLPFCRFISKPNWPNLIILLAGIAASIGGIYFHWWFMVRARQVERIETVYSLTSGSLKWEYIWDGRVNASHNEVAWREFSSVHEDENAVVLTSKWGEIPIPHAAFRSSEERHEIMVRIHEKGRLSARTPPSEPPTAPS